MTTTTTTTTMMMRRDVLGDVLPQLTFVLHAPLEFHDDCLAREFAQKRLGVQGELHVAGLHGRMKAYERVSQYASRIRSAP